MLRVVGHRLLIKPKAVKDQLDDALEEVKALKNMGFKVAKDNAGIQTLEGGTHIGVVVQVGPMAWKDSELGYGTPHWRPWCEEGDEVIYARYAGKPIFDPDKTGDEAKFVVINDVDIQAITAFKAQVEARNKKKETE